MWTFEIWSTKSFREASSSSQPILILLGGILVDLLLLFLFVSISRSSGMALKYADAITARLKSKSIELEKAHQLTALRAHQLEISNAELEQFACVASHDLQEPLRKVASYCELLGEEYGDILDEDGQLYIGFAIDGATRMRTLIQDLLEFSKINSSEHSGSVIKTEECCKLAILNLQSAIDESSAMIVLSELPEIVANKRHFTQLLQNLIGNAIKYRSDNRPKIVVDCESSGDQWIFSVADNGIGIQPEFHQRVFGIFKRLHGRQNYLGTGIGLAICQRIVEHWNGRIWIDATYENGCKVCFTVPKNSTVMSKLRGEELVAVTH
jgi:light-regulated signal transduction histidine kinase (bacteriophytochrome)